MTSDLLDRVRHLSAHARWADDRLLDTLRRTSRSDALREQAHVLAAHETWLARLEGRPPRCPVWPDLDFDGLEQLTASTHGAMASYLERLDPSDLDAEVEYRNSAGQSFTNSVNEILMHVFLHGQYHRGKVNLTLRQAGIEPAPTDYIAFVRGAPAATERDSTNAAPTR